MEKKVPQSLNPFLSLPQQAERTNWEKPSPITSMHIKLVWCKNTILLLFAGFVFHKLIDDLPSGHHLRLRSKSFYALSYGPKTYNFPFTLCFFFFAYQTEDDGIKILTHNRRNIPSSHLEFYNSKLFNTHIYLRI